MCCYLNVQFQGQRVNTLPNYVLRYPDWFLNGIKVIKVIENICRTFRYSAWCTRKCNSLSVLKLYAVYCRLWIFITVCATDCHWAPFWSKWIKFSHPHSVNWISIKYSYLKFVCLFHPRQNATRLSLLILATKLWMLNVQLQAVGQLYL